VAGEGYDVDSFARDAAAFAVDNHKPIVVAAPQDCVGAKFRTAGIPTFANQTEAVKLLGQLVEHTRLMRRPPREMAPPINVDVPAGASRFLSEWESLAFLKQHGMVTAPCRLCHTEQEVRSAAIELGLPVVLKACSAALPHKSDHRLVIVGLDSDA